MESRPENPEFRINSENFHPCKYQNLMYWLNYILLGQILFDLILYIPSIIFQF